MPTGNVLRVELAISGTIRLVNTEAERRRLTLAKKAAAKLDAIEHQKVDRSHKKGSLMKEFRRAADHKLQR
jgi:hypothetical protein